jgi:hypothetical protein
LKILRAVKNCLGVLSSRNMLWLAYIITMTNYWRFQ